MSDEQKKEQTPEQDPMKNTAPEEKKAEQTEEGAEKESAVGQDIRRKRFRKEGKTQIRQKGLQRRGKDRRTGKREGRPQRQVPADLCGV